MSTIEIYEATEKEIESTQQTFAMAREEAIYFLIAKITSATEKNAQMLKYLEDAKYNERNWG